MPAAPPAERLLRRAVVAGAVAFVVVVGWMAVEAVLRPDVGASFYGKGRFFTTSYWGPFLAFAVVGLGFTVYVFYRALQRLRSGALVPRDRLGPPDRFGPSDPHA